MRNFILSLACFISVTVLAQTSIPNRSQVVDIVNNFAIGHTNGTGIGTTLQSPTILGWKEHAVLILPDTQECTTNRMSLMVAQVTTWVAEGYNFDYVVGVGDITQTNAVNEYTNIMHFLYNPLRAMLTNAVVIVPRGNHDEGDDNFQTGRDSTTYDKYFNQAWHTTNAPSDALFLWYDGTGTNADNGAVIREIAGEKFIWLWMECFPRSVVTDWADSVMATNLDARTFFVTHAMLRSNGVLSDQPNLSDGYDNAPRDNYAGAADGQTSREVWENFGRKYAATWFCGHETGGGLAKTVLIGDNGKISKIFLINGQNGTQTYTQFGFGLMARLDFHDGGFDTTLWNPGGTMNAPNVEGETRFDVPETSISSSKLTASAHQPATDFQWNIDIGGTNYTYVAVFNTNGLSFRYIANSLSPTGPGIDTLTLGLDGSVTGSGLGSGTTNLWDNGVIFYADWDGANALVDQRSGRAPTVNGVVTIGEGITGTAMTSSGLGLRYPATIAATNALTFETWFYGDPPTPIVGVVAIMVQQFDSGANGSWYLGIQGSVGSQFKFSYVTNGIRADWLPLNPTPLYDSKWHHIALTFDTTNIVIYVDGSALASTPNSTPLSNGGVYPLYIAGTESASTYDIHGAYLDMTRIYDRALTSDEILVHYEANKPTDTSLLFRDELFSARFDGTKPDVDLVSGTTPKNHTVWSRSDGVFGNGADVRNQGIIWPSYLTNAAEITHSGWFQKWATNTGAASVNVLVARSDAAAAGTDYLAVEAERTPRMRIVTNGVAFNIQPGGGIASVTNGQWHLLTSTYSVSGGFARLYMDGVELASGVITDPLDNAGTYPVTVGGGYATTSTNSHFQGGLVDDVRIFGRALTADEVMAMYQARFPVPSGILTNATDYQPATATLTNLSNSNGSSLTNLPARSLQGAGGAGTPNTNGVSGQVLTSAGNGGVYWAASGSFTDGSGLTNLIGSSTASSGWGTAVIQTKNPNGSTNYQVIATNALTSIATNSTAVALDFTSGTPRYRMDQIHASLAVNPTNIVDGREIILRVSNTSGATRTVTINTNGWGGAIYWNAFPARAANVVNLTNNSVLEISFTASGAVVLPVGGLLQ